MSEEKSTDIIIDDIISECEKTNTDWSCIKDLIIGLGPEMNLLEQDFRDYTILSDIIFWHNQHSFDGKLYNLVKLFLENGYDVNANNGRNGNMCLLELCWICAGAGRLETAELLLDYGADTTQSYEEDNNYEGVEGLIDFQIGGWNDGDYEFLNEMEAYEEMILAAQNGEDYHGIRSFDSCLGKRLTKVEKLSFDHAQKTYNQDRRGSFQGALAFWYDDMPLIAYDKIYFTVNPHVPDKAVIREDITDMFTGKTGKKMRALEYDNIWEARLVFEDDEAIVIGGKENAEFFQRNEK